MLRDEAHVLLHTGRPQAFDQLLAHGLDAFAHGAQLLLPLRTQRRVAEHGRNHRGAVRWRVAVVGTNHDLELAEHAAGFFLVAAQHAQGAYAFTVQAEAFGERGRDKKVQAGGNEFGDDGAVFGQTVAKALVGHVQEGRQLARLARSNHLIPLRRADVVAGGVVAAGVQHDDGGRGRAAQGGQHGVEIDTAARGIVVGVVFDAKPSLGEQRAVVFPARIGNQHFRAGCQQVQKIGPNFQTAGATDGLHGGDAARLHGLAVGAEDQRLDAGIVGGNAVDRQVAACAGVFHQHFFCLAHAIEQRQFALVVVVDADTEIDFCRVGVGVELFVETQNRVAGGHSNGAKERHAKSLQGGQTNGDGALNSVFFWVARDFTGRHETCMPDPSQIDPEHPAAAPSGQFVRFPDSPFELFQPYPPAGDQPQAIAELVEGVRDGEVFQTLLGVTGSGKTFTMANVIARLGRPAIVFAPNKTLAAQLYSEFREFFPKNAVEYFVSYYDYYQPEAYVPQRDLFIEKDSAINEHIEQMRLSCTKSILERRDVLIVATVSAIYGIGQPEAYHQMIMTLRAGDRLGQRDMIAQLVRMQYQRNDMDFSRGAFRVRGDTIDIFPAEHSEMAIRVELFDEEIESLQLFDPLTGRIRQKIPRFTVYPSSHYVTPREQVLTAVETIKLELAQRLKEFVSQGKLVEAQRLEQRTRFDLEMLSEVGHCKGIENYSRHLSGAAPGEPPSTLTDYLPKDALMFLDESHVLIGQLGGMYNGDRARKTTLVEYGFRLPSALDNRPLKFEEFETRMRQVVFVSATPAQWEKDHSGRVVEQLVRPTGLVDPEVEVRPATHQVDDVLQEIRLRVERSERVLITTLTKRMAEQLSEYLADNGVKVRYLHSDIDTVERVEILRDLRLGTFDVLVGINLLREGLDIPEVSLVAILDADKEGFLRSERSLIQTIGRAARNLHGRAILYADQHTESMRRAIGETERRRAKQLAHNLSEGITPRSIVKQVRDLIDGVYSEKAGKEAQRLENDALARAQVEDMSEKDVSREIKRLEKLMMEHARNLAFEQAAQVRDQLHRLKARAFGAPGDDHGIVAA